MPQSSPNFRPCGITLKRFASLYAGVSYSTALRYARKVELTKKGKLTLLTPEQVETMTDVMSFPYKELN
jgi:hypothetical protein